jgi:hypothetical protein
MKQVSLEKHCKIQTPDWRVIMQIYAVLPTNAPANEYDSDGE